MATILRSSNFISITGVAADVTPADIFKDDHDHKVKRIEFKGGSDDDKCVVKNKTDAGATITILSVGDANVPDRCYFGEEGQYMEPYIDLSASTLSANHAIVIELM